LGRREAAKQQDCQNATDDDRRGDDKRLAAETGQDNRTNKHIAHLLQHRQFPSRVSPYESRIIEVR
jgi:hypothetical protein